jgi:CubicO group peptidase (beta-lactamase class C family)
MSVTGDAPVIRSIVTDAVAHGVFPGIVLLVHRGTDELCRLAHGHRQLHPLAEPMTEDTLFDLASVTKPLATALLVHQVTERDRIDLDRRLAEFLPKAQKDTGQITLRQLLLHTGGLPAEPGLQRFFPNPDRLDRDHAVKKLLAISPDKEPEKEVVYSCTGYELLGLFLEAVTGLRLAELFATAVAQPLGLENLMFCPPERLRVRAATTEFCTWRGRYVRGEVHDESSYCLGGYGGNAGLFGTADAVMGLLSVLAGDGSAGGVRVLSPARTEMMRQCGTEGLGRRRSYGFALKDDESPIGDALGPGAFGHTGFTGTSVWIDPDADLRIVALTNRVHLGRETTDTKIRGFRRNLHQAIGRSWL